MSLVAVGRCGGEVFLEPVRGFVVCRMGGKDLIRRENAWVGPKVLLSASQEHGEWQYAGLWLQKGILPAMTVANRRVADSFLLAFRSIFVALSFVFLLVLRSVLDRSSID